MQILGSDEDREYERPDHTAAESTDSEQGVEEVIIRQQDVTNRSGRLVRVRREFEVEVEVHTCADE